MAKAKSRHVEELPADIPEEALEVDSDIPLSDLEATHLADLARRTTRGPLSRLIPVFIDVETFVDPEAGITLRSQTLRQYVAASHLTALAIGIGDDPIELYYPATEEGLPDGVNLIDARLIAVLQMLAADPRYVFVAHNAAFDMRILRLMLGVPHPVNVWCTLEGAMGAWPELPGGFSLKNVSKKLQLPKALRKLDIDLGELTKLQAKAAKSVRAIRLVDLRESVVQWIQEIAELGQLVARGLWDGITITVDLCHRLLGIYNVRDVEAMRAIYWRQATRIGPPEQEIALLTHRQRKNYFHVNQTRLDELIIQLDKNAEYAEKVAGEYLTEDQKSDIFNRGDDGLGPLRSLRYTRLKNIVNDSLASETFTTVSAKKVSPIQLARNPTVRAVLEQTSRVGKMLSHRRRSAVFTGVDIVDLELGVWRAHTGRFSSPSVGRGLNCLAADTPVFVRGSGWLPIQSVPPGAAVWDGLEFVKCDGAAYMGERECIQVGSLWLTPDHLLLCEDNAWREAWVAPSFGLLNPAPLSAAALSSAPHRNRLATGNTIGSTSSASVGRSTALSACSSHPASSASLVLSAPGRQLSPWSRMTHSERRLFRAGTTSRTGASTTDTASSIAGAGAASPSAMNGETAALHSSGTSKGCRTTNGLRRGQRTPLIGSTTIADTSPATSGSATRRNRPTTRSGPSASSMCPSVSSRLTSGSPTPPSSSTTETATLRPVFDLLNCGPRNRFVAGEYVAHNCHNVPKHDKAVAEPVRRMFRFPDELCLVRGDLANVEYRIEGLITGCKTVIDMFNPALGGNINNDPYMLAWKAMTGATIKDKKDPVRQVSKGAVLGLGYVMSATGYAKVLLTALSDPRSGVTEELLRKTILDSGWGRPDGGQVDQIVEKLGCSQVVALAAFHINRVFNEAHPEFKQTAYWLVDVVKAIATCGTGSIGRDAAKEAIEMAYMKSTAPNRDLINLFIDDDPLPRYPSIRVACGHWGPTVCWREPYMRRNPFDPEDRGPRLTIRKSAGRVGTFKSFSPQLAIENVTQAAARNALCMGLLKLKSRGFLDVIHVHDEIMIICKRDRDSVLAAKEALLWAFGPNHDMPYAWSILVKPNEVTVTQSLYEDEDDIAEFITKKDANKNVILGADGKPANFPGPDRWGKILRNEPGCLDNLP